MRCWSEANPYEMHLKALYSQKVAVRCEISGFGVSLSLSYFATDSQSVRLGIEPLC
jgi:hypothetical protein